MFRSIFRYTCPRCRKGHLFYKPFSMDTAYKMPDKCSVCDQSYMPEPGFYFGSMFISYIISGFTLIGLALIMVFALKWNVNMSLGLIVLSGFISHNAFFRLSRSIWIHLMVKYKPLK